MITHPRPPHHTEDKVRTRRSDVRARDEAHRDHRRCKEAPEQAKVYMSVWEGEGEGEREREKGGREGSREGERASVRERESGEGGRVE